MYRVIKSFIDLMDNEKAYFEGEEYSPSYVDEKRIRELTSSNNKRGMPLIEKVEPVEKPKRGRKKK